MLTRRPTDLGHGPLPDDYEIREDGSPVGRIYKAPNVIKDPWVWFITARSKRPSKDKGEADSLENALEAFKRTWEG